MVERQIGNIVLVTSILLNGPERNMKLQAFVYNLDWWGWGTSEYCSTSGFFFHGLKKTQGEKNPSHKKTQALFWPKTQATGGFFKISGQKLKLSEDFSKFPAKNSL